MNDDKMRRARAWARKHKLHEGKAMYRMDVAHQVWKSAGKLVALGILTVHRDAEGLTYAVLTPEGQIKIEKTKPGPVTKDPLRRRQDWGDFYVCDGAHWTTLFIYDQIRRRKLSVRKLAIDANVTEQTMRGWARQYGVGSLKAVERVLAALGYNIGTAFLQWHMEEKTNGKASEKHTGASEHALIR
jgi:hypothetical protein